jgi:protein-disulfide isomerase
VGEAKRRQQSGHSPHGHGRSRSRYGIAAAVVLLVVVIVGLLWWITQPPAPESASLPTVSEDAQPFPRSFDSVGIAIGDPDAPVVVREFADYQCPACERFSSAAKKLRDEYVESGKVRFVFFDLPLRQHANAREAAMAARCAADQGAYWAMHDRLFENQTEWSGSGSAVGMFTRYAEELGLDQKRLRRCVDTRLHKEAIDQSIGVARQLQVTSTPTVFVDNIRLTQPGWGQLSAVVERELKSGQ